jgi:hypothetical protein
MPEPPRINRDAVYALNSARERLGITKNCLPREIRLGRLRAAKRAKKIMILGEWLIEWIEGGEIKRPRPEAAQVNGTNR